MITGEKFLPAAMKDADRPSAHGAMLGKFLSDMAAAGRAIAEADGEAMPPMCSTCAFRPGAMPNLMAGTVLTAFKIVVGADDAAFACHHSGHGGEPEKLCSGYLATMLVPFEVMKQEFPKFMAALDALPPDGPDALRARFDAWLDTLPQNELRDVYEIGRLWAKQTTREAWGDERDEADAVAALDRAAGVTR